MRDDGIIMAALSAVIVACAVMAATDLASYMAGRSEYSGLMEELEEGSEVSHISDSDPGPEGEVTPDRYAAFRAKNPDFVGVLSLPILGITYPVVQGEDNEKYLETTFEGRSNPAGCLFMDCENDRDLKDPVTYIYGHNMKDGSMFGKLRRFLSEKELRSADIRATLSTSEGDHEYSFSKAEVVDLNEPPPPAPAEDSLLVLYTCYGRSGDKKLLIYFSEKSYRRENPSDPLRSLSKKDLQNLSQAGCLPCRGYIRSPDIHRKLPALSAV